MLCMSLEKKACPIITCIPKIKKLLNHVFSAIEMIKILRVKFQ